MKNLPEDIVRYIRHKYPGGMITSGTLVPLVRTTHYQVDVERDDVIFHLLFDQNGKFLKSSREVLFPDEFYTYEDTLDD